MKNKDKIFKMLGFQIAIKPEPKLEIVKTESTKRKPKKEKQDA